ncbi:MAG: tRNA methyltransferase [Peptococcaceae bacterium BICA1-7]|nr:MAG: tRNA methyltransferase [Peptococcaceae bacterium BICA1-7]HBV96682.1 tRNA (uridine(34)/cytosine(34)/5-carboxymethylaminomethyluridine(34)-2'-O)-methyltransferase TrmL [Desulfotomaculum sp.]
MRVVLVEPEIPANTGNVARTCAVTGAELHLVRPLGFSIDDRQLKRAGLDYWHLLRVYVHDSFEQLRMDYPGGRFFFLSTKGKKFYSETRFSEDDFIVFGRETAGLAQTILKGNEEYMLRIPMLDSTRSLNLSNSVALVVYEAMRQLDFKGMS